MSGFKPKLALLILAVLPFFPLYAGIASFAFFQFPRTKPSYKLFNAFLVATGLILLATQFAYQLPLNPLNPILQASNNLILNTENIANWSQPPGLSAFSLLATEPFNNLSKADCIELLPSPGTYAVEYAYQQPIGSDLQGSIYVKSFDNRGTQELGIRLILGSTDGKVIYYQEPFALTSDWQRLSLKHHFDKSAQSTSAALLLYNPSIEKSLLFCGWGAMLSEGNSGQAYTPYSEILGQANTSWLKRGLNSLFITFGFLLIMISIENCKRLWSMVEKPRAFAILALSTFGLAVLGIFQKTGLIFEPYPRASGLSFHPNLYSAQLVCLSLILSTYFKSRYLNALLIPLSFLALWAAGSRGAFIAYSICLIIYFYKRLLRLNFFAFIALLVVIVTAIFLNSEWLGRMGDFTDHNHSRQDLFKASLSISLERPLFGWGLGSVPAQLIRALWTENPEIYAHAHNLIAQIMIEFGLTGLLASVWLVRAFILDLRFSGQMFLALPLLAVLINNQFDVLLTQPFLYIPVILWLGYIYHCLEPQGA